MSEGLAGYEWISGVLESTVYQDYEPLSHLRKSVSLRVEPTVTVMKAGNHLHIDPSTVCHRCEKCLEGHCRRFDERGMGVLRCCDCCEMESCQSWAKIES